MLWICLGQDRRPGQPNSSSFVQPVPAPVAESAALEFEDAQRVGKLIALPLLRLGHDVPRGRQLQIGDRSNLAGFRFLLSYDIAGDSKN
ncbi:MAG: hypothetical protein DMG76_09715 [Acidobacteria bacterium]|nr:MAG: hypothetical protein DMG76_09715 [Acidobacteriota bacterium]